MESFTVGKCKVSPFRMLLRSHQNSSSQYLQIQVWVESFILTTIHNQPYSIFSHIYGYSFTVLM